MVNFVILLSIINLIQAKDLFTIDFIKSYIENERRVTDVHYNYLGWPKSDILNLVKVLSNSSIRSASRYNKTSLQDISTLFLIDLRFSSADVFVNVTKYFRSPYRWLVIVDDEHDNEVWDLPLSLDSDFVLAVKNGDIFTLIELFKPSPRVSTVSIKRGYYNGTLVDIRPRREMFRRRSNLMGQPLVMSNVIQDTNSSKYHFLKEDRLNLQYDSISKMSWYVTRLAFEMLNATSLYTFSYSFGVKSNGEWTGMMRDLGTGKAVLGTSCDIDPNKMEVVVFTDTIVPVKTKFIFRLPPLSYISNIYTLIFSINVWIAIIICSAISTAAIYLESKWEASYNQSATQLEGNISDAIFLTMSALSQQGCAMEPRRLSGRIMSWITFTSMMALFAAYSANIVVLLQAPSTAVRSLEQLAHSKIMLAAVDTDYNRHAFKDAKDPIRKEINKKIIPEKGKEHFYSLDYCVKNLRQGLFAFHSILEPVYHRIENTFFEPEKCDLMEVDYMRGFDQHVPIYKHSPYLELLKVSFKRIREAGICSALEKRYQVQKPRCMNKGTTFSSVGIQNVRPVLLLMVLGVVTSVIILMVEIIVYKIIVLQESTTRHIIKN